MDKLESVPSEGVEITSRFGFELSREDSQLSLRIPFTVCSLVGEKDLKDLYRKLFPTYAQCSLRLKEKSFALKFPPEAQRPEIQQYVTALEKIFAKKRAKLSRRLFLEKLFGSKN